VNRARLLLRRLHIWLGWAVAIPFLLWTVSGLVMVAKPIEEVRGESLIRQAPLLPSGPRFTLPPIGPRPVSTLVLEQRSEGSRWLIRYADGQSRLADAASGRLLPPLTAAEAAATLKARYTGAASIKAVDRISADAPPIELRRNIEAWRVTMSDGTRFYLSAATGEIVARRTAFWRIYDFMWGLHIMDFKGREDTHNPLVIGFALLALATTLMATLLLPMTLRRRRRGS